MDKNIQCILLKNDKVLIGEVVEVMADIGAPDCKIVSPYLLSESGELTSWLNFTNQTDIIVHKIMLFTKVYKLYTLRFNSTIQTDKMF